MKKFGILTISLLLLLVGSAGRSTAASTLSYHGRLVDSSQTLRTGDYCVMFRMFNTQTGGSNFWSEEWCGGNAINLPTSRPGVFDVDLGTFTPLPALNPITDRYLELEIRPASGGSYTTLSPRQKIGTSLFSVNSTNLNGQPASYYTDAANLTGSLPGGVLPGNVVTTDGNHTITGDWDMDGAVTVNDSLDLTSATVVGLAAHETDPVYLASAAAGITTPMISNWNTSFGWGDHSIVGYLTAVTNGDFSAYSDLTAEGYLNNDAGNDLLTRTQGDGRWLQTEVDGSVSNELQTISRVGSTGVVTLSDSGGTFQTVADGTATNNTLRWNGSNWVQSTNLTNNDTDVTVSNNIVVNGNTDIGSDSSDTLTVNALIDSDLTPDGSTRSLGSDTNRWDTLYLTGSTLDIGVSGNKSLVGYNTTDNQFEIDPDGDGTPELVLEDSGRLGLGTEDPGDVLDVVSESPTSSTGSVTVTSGLEYIYEFEVVGDYAYVLKQSSNTLIIVDHSDKSNPVIVNSISGGMFDPRQIDIQGDYLYIGDHAGNEIFVFSIEDPINPVVVDSISTGSDEVIDVHVSGRYLYAVTNSSDTFRIFDVSDPTNLTQLSSISAAGITNAELLEKDGYLYMSRSSLGDIAVYDVSDPTSPSQLTTINVPNTPLNMDVYGNNLYVTDTNYFTGKFTVLDISDPSNISIVSTRNDNNKSHHQIKIEGKYAYVLTGSPDQVRIYDLSVASKPLVGTINTGWSLDMDVSEGYVFTAVNSQPGVFTIYEVGGADLQHLDVGSVSAGDINSEGNLRVGRKIQAEQSIASRTLIASEVVSSVDGVFSGNLSVGAAGIFKKQVTLTSSSGVNPVLASSGDLWWNGANLYFNDGSSNVDILEDKHVSDGTVINNTLRWNGSSWVETDSAIFESDSITLAGTVDTAGNAVISVYVEGKYAYITDGLGGFHVIDVTRPSAPVIVSTLALGGYPIGIAAAGDYVYVLNSYGSMYTIDVSNPSSPQQISNWSTTDYPQDIYISGRYAYLANGKSLGVVDISNPALPSLVGTYSYGIYGTEDIFVSGKYAYVTAYGSGLRVMDVSNPTAPTQVGTYNAGNVTGIHVSGRYAFLNNITSGLSILDVVDPTNPVLVSTYDPGNAVFGVYVAGDYVYLVDMNTGLHILDISNPASPVFIDSYNTSGQSQDVFVAGHHAYVTDNAAGLQILNVPGVELQTLKVGGLETGTISTASNVHIGNDLLVRNGLHVGRGGIFSGGSLSVRGTIIADGNITANAFDLAERFPANEDLINGTLVMVDRANPKYVVSSDNVYANTVIGVVSTNPGFTLGAESNEEFEYTEYTAVVALSGRVPVHVTSENGLIKAGDKLVASSELGKAMRACGHTFCLSGVSVGIALEDMEIGDDSVMMFVNLDHYSSQELPEYSLGLNLHDHSEYAGAPVEGALDKVLSLGSVSYESEGNRYVRFMASTLQETFPELVTSDNGSDTLNIEGFLVYLVEAIKEEHALIEDLQDQVDQLIERIEELEETP